MIGSQKIWFLLLFSNLIFAQPGTTEYSLLHILNLRDDGFLDNSFNGTTHPALIGVPERNSFSFLFDYEDLYREAGLITINKSRSTLVYNQSLKSIAPAASFAFSISRDNLQFNHVEQSGSIPDLNCTGTFCYQGNRYKSGLSVEYLSMRGQNQLTIDHYPKSENDWLLDRYFYDLLQPTFGNLIDVSVYLRKLGAVGEFMYKVHDRCELGTKMSYSEMRNQTQLIYLNTTEKLAGEKIIKIPLKNKNLSMQFLVKTSIQIMQIHFFFSVDRSRYGLDLVPDNPSKVNDIYIDYTDLGNCLLRRSGYGTGLGFSIPVLPLMEIQITDAIATDRWQGEGTIFTPVLGFEVLPIAHNFRGTIDARTETNHLQINLQHRPWRKLSYNLNLDWLATNLRPQWQGTAYMEFGINDHHYEESLHYNGNIFMVGLAPVFNLRHHWSLMYSLKQVIPLFREEKGAAGEKPPAAEEIKPSHESKTGGGRIHQLTVTYNF